ncbi:MAG TPA: hypothetical protein VGN08_06285 [Solirubrobacteraceae bacterium]
MGRDVFERIEANGRASQRPMGGVPAPLGLVLLATSALALAWIDPAALCALPALVLPLLFVLRRYPGERVLRVLSAARRRRWERPRASVPGAARLGKVLPRGGLLLARSLAVRPPPAASLTAS